MSWSQRIFSMMANPAVKPEWISSEAGMGITSGLNKKHELTQNHTARVHSVALPLEYTGVAGEYDPTGLAKRVARALDAHAEVNHIKTLCIIQHGDRISLLGKVASVDDLNRVVALASQVEGTREVDVSQVVIENMLQPIAS